eukprot:3074678-Heterocapsa_arctica.AAC.1
MASPAPPDVLRGNPTTLEVAAGQWLCRKPRRAVAVQEAPQGSGCAGSPAGQQRAGSPPGQWLAPQGSSGQDAPQGQPAGAGAGSDSGSISRGKPNNQ